MDRLVNTNMYLLVEATANQVNQFGGYTGMKPKEYRDFVYNLCEKNNFPCTNRVSCEVFISE